MSPWSNCTDFGITGIEHQWFRNCLTEQSQSVVVNGHLSNTLSVTAGVPRDQFLAHCFSFCFLNDLPAVMETCTSNMFADDTEIEDTCKREDHSILENNINSDLGRLNSYFDTNRLGIDVAKCGYMQIENYQSLAKMPHLMIHINNEPFQNRYQSLSIWQCTLMSILNGMNI